jgi:hypothetical protein
MLILPIYGPKFNQENMRLFVNYIKYIFRWLSYLSKKYVYVQGKIQGPSRSPQYFTPKSDRIFKEILRKRLSFTWGWPEVLSMAPIIKILHRGARQELFSWSPLCIYLVMDNELEIAFFWPIKSRHLNSETYSRIRLHGKGPPKLSLRSRGLRFFLHVGKMTKNSPLVTTVDKLWVWCTSIIASLVWFVFFLYFGRSKPNINVVRKQGFRNKLF